MVLLLVLGVSSPCGSISGPVQTYWTPFQALKLLLLCPSPFASQNLTPRNWLPTCLEPPRPPCLGELHLLTFLILVSLWHSKPSILPPPLWLTLFCCNVIPIVTRDQDHGLSTNLWAERAEKVKASNVNYLIKHRFNLYQLLWNWFSYWEYQKLIFFLER